MPKTHAHCRDRETAELCREIFPEGINIHETLDLVALQSPIGADGFVNERLFTKLDPLENLITEIGAMEHKHEAFLILQKCASQCKVNHIMRTIPPRQCGAFIKAFDKLMRRGFETIVGTAISDIKWRLAKLPSKYGGMGLQSGLATMGAQYASSVIKTAADVTRFLDGEYDVETVLEKNAMDWLREQIGMDISVRKLIGDTLSQPTASTRS